MRLPRSQVDPVFARNLRWTRQSNKLRPVNFALQIQAQHLGRIDAQLIDAHIPENDGCIDQLTDHITISYLWVLGAFELIRTLDQRARSKELYSPEDRDRIRDLKKQFMRIRVPLAKLEPARAHEKTDNPVAWPTFADQAGVGWMIAKGKFVTRKDLADRLLEMLESLPSTE